MQAGLTVPRLVFAVAVLLPLLRIREVKRPRRERTEVGAVGSIELMVAVTVAAIATFNLKKVHLALRACFRMNRNSVYSTDIKNFNSFC